VPADDERESPEQVGHNIAKGTIKDMAYLGSMTTYHVKLETGMIVKVTHTNAARHSERFTWGDEVYVWWCGSDSVVLTQ
jgi:putrescine transport system ATP-binding protein